MKVMFLLFSLSLLFLFFIQSHPSSSQEELDASLQREHEGVTKVHLLEQEVFSMHKGASVVPPQARLDADEQELRSECRRLGAALDDAKRESVRLLFFFFVVVMVAVVNSCSAVCVSACVCLSVSWWEFLVGELLLLAVGSVLMYCSLCVCIGGRRT